MWNHNINIHPSELLCTKTKSIELINIKKIDNLHFLPNNILTRIFKEFKKKELLLIDDARKS